MAILDHNEMKFATVGTGELIDMAEEIWPLDSDLGPVTFAQREIIHELCARAAREGGDNL